jgi:uracil-DNA glycosylase
MIVLVAHATNTQFKGANREATRANMPSGINNQKKDDLLELVRKRQAHRSPRYFNLADFHGGFYECDFVSPWTISANNLNASLMLIGQDWSSSDSLSRPRDEKMKRIGQTWNLPANQRLRDLLKRHMTLSFADTYATNVFPFIKYGRMNATISVADLRYCAKEYAIPQIKIVGPRMVVCLGKQTFEAVRYALQKDTIDWREASKPGGHTLLDDIEIYGVPHPGNWGVRNAGGMSNVDEIWSGLGARLYGFLDRAECSAAPTS